MKHEQETNRIRGRRSSHSTVARAPLARATRAVANGRASQTGECTRREMIAMTMGIIGSFSVLRPLEAAAAPIRMGGKFGFSFDNGTLKVDARDVVIDGLTIPKFTWQWIGLSIAEGVLLGVGGA